MPVGLSETLFPSGMHERSFWVPGSVDFDVSRVQAPFQDPPQDILVHHLCCLLEPALPEAQ
jgi:hypothetical protein